MHQHRRIETKVLDDYCGGRAYKSFVEDGWEGRLWTRQKDIPPTVGHCRAGLCKHPSSETPWSLHAQRQNQGEHTVVTLLHRAQHRKDSKLRLRLRQIKRTVPKAHDNAHDSLSPSLTKGNLKEQIEFKTKWLQTVTQRGVFRQSQQRSQFCLWLDRKTMHTI